MDAASATAPDASEPVPASLLRLRAAIKFSLWGWAAYWPGMGLVLAVRGLDPISLLFCSIALTQFILLLTMGALKVDPVYSRNMKTFLVERPLYFVFALFLLMAVGSSFAPVVSAAIVVFGGAQLVGIILVLVALARHLQDHDLSIKATKADQLILTIIMLGVPSIAVFVDAFRPEGVLNTSPEMVALLNLLNLAFPTLMLVASRPFRAPLRRPNVSKVGAVVNEAAPAKSVDPAQKRPWDARFE